MTNTIRASFDVASRVSRELSRFMEAMVNDPDRERLPTLGAVRAELRRGGSEAAQDGEYLHPQDEVSLLAEVDRLIDEFGREALVIDFVVASASEGLSRIIQAAVDDITIPRAPTLRIVREAMKKGLTARLIGNGAIDEDDEGALLEEIDDLVERYGEHAPAESFIRFE